MKKEYKELIIMLVSNPCHRSLNKLQAEAQSHPLQLNQMMQTLKHKLTT